MLGEERPHELDELASGFFQRGKIEVVHGWTDRGGGRRFRSKQNAHPAVRVVRRCFGNSSAIIRLAPPGRTVDHGHSDDGHPAHGVLRWLTSLSFLVSAFSHPRVIDP